MSGESAESLSTRVKKEMLFEQERYHIKAVDECQCNENFHKNLMYNCIIPCKHTISEDSIININYPKLDHNKFINVTNFLELPSKLTCHISAGNTEEDLDIEDNSFTTEEIDEALDRAHSLFSSYGEELINSTKEQCSF